MAGSRRSRPKPDTKQAPGRLRPVRVVRELAATTEAGSDAWWRTTLRDDDYVASLNAISPLQRVRLLKRGVPAATLPVLARDLGMSKERLYATLGLARATVDRRLRSDQRLTPAESERVFGIARLVGQVAEVVESSGEPKDFDAAKWLAAWLDKPVPALGGMTPGSLLDTAEGREIVGGLIARNRARTRERFGRRRRHPVAYRNGHSRVRRG